MVVRWVCLGLLVGSVVALAEPAPMPSDCTARVVSTTSGDYCGRTQRLDGVGEVHAYLGIPYGESTSGKNRWARPVPATPSQGVTKATTFGPSCPQSSKDPPAGYVVSEDCLSLNVWTPVGIDTAQARDLPVMVFIYGGAFVEGNSANPAYSGDRIATMGDVVVVTLNYRLGALGFMAGIGGLSGNYGFIDQQLALRWVQDNIRAFGGDPHKVTIFGESAGAMSVGLHLVAPGSQGLFRGAIMESNPYGLPYKTIKGATTFARTLRDRLDCYQGGVACMRQKGFQEVLRHQESTMLKVEGLFSGLPGFLVWAPVVDGGVIPEQPFETPITVPVLIGTNSNEGLLFASEFQEHRRHATPKVPKVEYKLTLDLEFPKEQRRKIRKRERYEPRRGDNTSQLSQLLTDYIFTCANRLVMAQSNAPVYAYQFTQVPSFATWPGVPLCDPSRGVVCHAAELPFVFGNPYSARFDAAQKLQRFTPAERKLSNEMIGYWTRFAATLDPNHAGARRWPRFTAGDRVRLILNTDLSEKSDLDAECWFWDSIGYDMTR